MSLLWFRRQKGNWPVNLFGFGCTYLNTVPRIFYALLRSKSLSSLSLPPQTRDDFLGQVDVPLNQIPVSPLDLCISLSVFLEALCMWAGTLWVFAAQLLDLSFKVLFISHCICIQWHFFHPWHCKRAPLFNCLFHIIVHGFVNMVCHVYVMYIYILL